VRLLLGLLLQPFDKYRIDAIMLVIQHENTSAWRLTGVVTSLHAINVIPSVKRLGV
jgi:hypothetical protein